MSEGTRAAGKERVVALDIGSVRVGVAISDPLGVFAQGLTVLRVSDGWISELAHVVNEYDAKVILVGIPCRTDGREGPEAENMRKTVERLAKRFPDLDVISWDERFTTVIAERALLEADVSRAGRKKCVDMVAATLLLQNYLDSRSRKEECGEVVFEPPIPAERPLSGKRVRARGRGRRNPHE